MSSLQAKESGAGENAVGNFAARAQSAADKNEKGKAKAVADPAGGGKAPSSDDQKSSLI